MFYPIQIHYEIRKNLVYDEKRMFAKPVGEPVIIISGRDEKKKKVVFEDKNFEPYFYAIPEQNRVEEIKKKIEKICVKQTKVKRVKIVEMMELNKIIKTLKIFCYLPKDVSILKDAIRNTEGVLHKREYDIPFAKRYCMDKQIKFLAPYEIENGTLRKLKGKSYDPITAAFDIEIYKPDFDAKENPITSIGLYSKDKKLVFSYKKSNLKNAVILENEKEMLEKFFESISEFDILLSYNGDYFDLPFLKTRCEELKIKHPILLSKNKANFRNGLHIDLYKIISKHLSSEVKTRTLKLNEVAKFFLGEGKTKFEITESKALWDSGSITETDKLLEYNLQDCKITFLIGEKILPLEYRFSNIIGLDLLTCTRSGFSQLVENYLMMEMVKKSILIPNNPSDKEIMKRRSKTYIGGYVHKPIPGIHENIHVLDFKSLYPSILVTHNISPDTLEKDGELEVKINKTIHRFTKKRKGFLVDIVENLINRRAKIKRKGGKGVEEKALKTLANAIYGYLGFFAARGYSKECAESITALGRKYIINTIHTAQEDGFKVIYGDTDSLMVSGDKKKIKIFLKKINKNLPGIMELEYEGGYKRGLFADSVTGGAKKRYALITEKGDLEIKGFEFVRGDWSKIAKETQEKVLEFVLNCQEKKAVEFIKETIKEIKTGKIKKDKLIINRRLTKSPDNYERIDPHIKVARDLERRGIKVNKGSVIQYIIAKKGKTISEKAQWYEETLGYDPDYYINNQVVPAAIRILSVLGYSKEDLIGKQKNLGDFR